LPSFCATARIAAALREEMQIEFTIEDGVWVLDAVKVRGRPAPRCASPWLWPRTDHLAR
jgi:hypothetical protein